MINIILDDDIKEQLTKVFSCLIKSNNNDYDSSLALSILQELRKIIYPSELYGEYWIIYDKLINLSKIKLVMGGKLEPLTRNVLDNSMQINIDKYVSNSEVKVAKMMMDVGMEFDPQIELQFEQASDLLYTQTMKLFDEMYDYNYNTSEAFILLQDLGALVKDNLIRQSINTQSQILMKGVKIDKTYYRGTEGVEKFNDRFRGWMNTRFSTFLNKNKQEFSFTSAEKNKEFRTEFKHSIHEIMKFGYAPLDDRISICNSDVITVVGDEGVGKTNFVVDLALKAMLTGKDVLFMTGESALTKIKNMVTARYIYDRTNQEYKMNWKEVAAIEDLDEDVQIVVEDAEIQLTEGEGIGRLHLIRKFTYENVYEDIANKCEKFPNIGLVIIDHINRLDSNGQWTSKGILNTDKQKVDYLYEKIVDVSDDYDIACVLLAHSNTQANQYTKKDTKNIGTRIGATSSATSKDADLVIYLRKNDLLKKQDMIKMQIVKVREGSDNIRDIILRREGACSVFIYDENYQIEERAPEFDEEDLA